MAYSIINPWRYGIGESNVANTLGYRFANPDPTETGKWTQWSQNDEVAWAWKPFKESNFESNESYLPSFSDAFDPKEAQKQNDFLSKFVPALQKGRSDIWGAFNSAYGQDAIKNLCLDFGEYGGGPNLLTKEIGGNVNDPEFYDPTNRSLKKFLGGPVDLFKQAAKDPKHFGIVGGPGYLPYSYDEITSDRSKLSSLGLFLDDKGKPIIGGGRRRPSRSRVRRSTRKIPGETSAWADRPPR